jgi:hypothetical protein
MINVTISTANKDQTIILKVLVSFEGSKLFDINFFLYSLAMIEYAILKMNMPKIHNKNNGNNARAEASAFPSSPLSKPRIVLAPK